MVMDQKWFELRDSRRRELNNAVWIPLRAIQTLRKVGDPGHVGHLVEFYGVGSLLVFRALREKAEKLGWMDIGISHEHSGYCQNGRYIPADHFEPYKGDAIGIHPVLEQRGNRDEQSEWHLHQDLAISLSLKREGDVWVAPDEGYLEIVRLRRRESGKPCLLEIRAEFLKDYLCARSMALYVTSYRNREEVLEEVDRIDWSDNPLCESEGGARWEGRVREIHEGGDPYGESVATFHVSRTDVDPKEDVPVFEFPDDKDVTSQSWVREFEGRKIYIVNGELWRNEWVEPAEQSPRIRWDERPSTVSFIVDASGVTADPDELKNGSRWLWFRPEVIMGLAHRRGGHLHWYTRDTGGVRCSPDSDIHFGMNGLGLVNAYAKDIALLPEWQQRIWAGHNITPDGGVSEELLASQMAAHPAATQAPEEFLPKAIERLNKISNDVHGISIFRDHDHYKTLLAVLHRFRAIDQPGLFALAKDIARLTADSIDTAAIHKKIVLPSGKKWGSLKSLENLLALHVEPEIAHSQIGPLFGIYELRLADAHLASSLIKENCELIGVDCDAPIVLQGFALLDACVSCLWSLGDALQEPKVR